LSAKGQVVDAEVQAQVTQTAKGQTLSQISKGMLSAIDPDEIQAQAKQGKGEYHEPTEKEIREVRETRIKHALAPLATNPDLRNLLKKIQKAADQTIDIISRDTDLCRPGPEKHTDQRPARHVVPPDVRQDRLRLTGDGATRGAAGG
jgi:type I restriction enzyme R subunit